MSIAGIVLAASLSSPIAPEPVLWLHPRGDLLVASRNQPGRLTPGARTVQTPLGVGLDLNGTRGGLLLGDLPPLRLGGSVTISTWMYLRSYVNDGGGSQVLFRGDDRNGLDCYSMAILSDGIAQFGIGSPDGTGADVRAEVPLNEWVRVTGSFDAASGELRLWIGNRLAATRTTSRRLLVDLDGGWAPGLGIGNVQNDRGPHNQPLNGTLVDLRLYDRVVEPSELGGKYRGL